jgi:hypothetical protein
VLVVGRAEEVTEAETIARLGRGRARLWRTGEAARWVRIVPSKLTGRRICGGDRAVTTGDGLAWPHLALIVHEIA